MATETADAQKAMRETTTVEVSLELLLNIPRQGRALCRQVLPECRVVFLDDLVKEVAIPVAS